VLQEYAADRGTGGVKTQIGRFLSSHLQEEMDKKGQNPHTSVRRPLICVTCRRTQNKRKKPPPPHRRQKLQYNIISSDYNWQNIKGITR